MCFSNKKHMCFKLFGKKNTIGSHIIYLVYSSFYGSKIYYSLLAMNYKYDKIHLQFNIRTRD